MHLLIITQSHAYEIIILHLRYEISKLEEEQNEVKKNLKLIESRTNQNKDDHLTEELEEFGQKIGM